MASNKNQQYFKYKDQQLLQKKNAYDKKNNYSIFLKKIKIRGLTKYETNKLVKMAINQQKIQIEINDRIKFPMAVFYDCYNFKNDSDIVEIDAILESDSGFVYCCDADKADLYDYFKNHDLVLQFRGDNPKYNYQKCTICKQQINPLHEAEPGCWHATHRRLTSLTGECLCDECYDEFIRVCSECHDPFFIERDMEDNLTYSNWAIKNNFSKCLQCYRY